MSAAWVWTAREASFGKPLPSRKRATRIFPLALRAPVTRTVKFAVPVVCASSGADRVKATVKSKPTDRAAIIWKRRHGDVLRITGILLLVFILSSAGDEHEESPHRVRHLWGKLAE